MEKVNLSVEVAGMKFKNPLIVASSDLTCDVRGIKLCVEAGAGGIVAKGLSVQPYSRTKTCPFYFSLERFGRGFDRGVWLTTEGFAREIPEKWIKEVGAEAVKICHDADCRFIAEMTVQVGDKDEDLLELGKKFEEMGADMISMIMYACTNDPNRPVNIPKLYGDKIKAMKGVVSIPVEAKVDAKLSQIYIDAAVESEKAGASLISVNNCPPGIFIDVEKEEFYGVPAVNAVGWGRASVPPMLATIIEMKRFVKTPLSPSGGIWEWSDAISFILLGCSTIQICSSAYFRGRKIFTTVLNGIEDFMIRKGYHSINDFYGKLLPKVRPLAELCPDVYPLPAPITPVIDYERCNFCGLCLDGCIYGGIDKIDKKRKEVVQNKELCWGCGMCVSRCPRDAMKLVDRSGVVRWDGHGEAALWLPPR